MPADQRSRVFGITISGIALAVAVATFPPWHWNFRQTSSTCGYSFIWATPTDWHGCSIDIVRLLVEWAAIGGLLTIAIMLNRFWNGPTMNGSLTPLSAQPPAEGQSPTPSPPSPAMLPQENRSGAQPPISLRGHAGLSLADRQRAYNQALILNEQDRRARAVRENGKS